MTDVTPTTIASEARICLNGGMTQRADDLPLGTNLPAPRLCGCGCGGAVTRRYRPGHDARHKSQLVTAAREATTTWSREQAVNEVLRHGWEAWLDGDLLRNHPLRNHRRQIRIQAIDVERWLVGPDGVHHARKGCTHLTQSARAIGQVHPITRLACEAVITRVDNTAEALMAVTAGFDLCGECAIDWTLDEVAESNKIRQEMTLQALDEEGTIRRNRKPARKISLAEWTVQPDPGPRLNPFAAPPIGLPDRTLPIPTS